MSLGQRMWKLLKDFGTACWEVFKLPFWLIGLGFKRFFGMGWQKITMLIGAAIVVTVVVGTTFVKATSQPGFCVSCHYMQPYFDSWKHSTHKDVQCIQCHIPPGLEGTVKHKFMALSMIVNYATGLYKRSKPWAEIDDRSCLRSGCHDTRLLQGVENFKGVRFDHRPHLEQPRRDRQLRCTSCHAQIVQGQHITVTEGTCFLCHFKPDAAGKPTELSRCTHCHTPPSGANVPAGKFNHSGILERGVDCLSCHATAVSGDGYVPPERCSMCHAQVDHIQRYNDLPFVHSMHVTEHKVDCLQCHIAIRHGKDVSEEAHPDEACAQCHSAPAAVWKGELPGIPPAPSAMAKVGMTCSSCHPEPVHLPGGKFAAPQCSPCHTPDYDALWPMWKTPLMRSIDDLERRAKSLPNEKRETILNALTAYRAGNPVHNPELLADISREIGDVIQGSAGQCASCHPSAGDAAPVWNGRTVDHRAHVKANVSCTECHETEPPHHGALKLKPNQCNECHHQRVTASVNCESCHVVQGNIYRGKIEGAEASVMAAAEIACTDCHAIDGKNVIRISAEACIGCHDNAYADTLKQWQQRGDTMLKEIESRLRLLTRDDNRRADYQRLEAMLLKDRSRTVHNPELFSNWKQKLEVTP